MSVSAPKIVAKRQAEISSEEWDARVQLAACYRIFDMLGWTEMIFNHITLRVPGPERHFLINPYGLWYREVTASNLVKIDPEGNQIGPSESSVNRAGFVIHSAIHAAREDAHCIMHTHTTAGLSYHEKPVPIQVELMHTGGLAGGSAASHGDAVVKGVKEYVDQFAAKIRAAN